MRHIKKSIHSQPKYIPPPNEVEEVFYYSMIGFCGSEAMERCRATIEKYPEYFPWEHKYKSIPKEVHEAYYKEMNPTPLKWGEGGSLPVLSGGGLIDQIPNKEYKPIKTSEEFMNILKEANERSNKAFEEELAEGIRARQIWDKHYKKYGLSYFEYPRFV